MRLICSFWRVLPLGEKGKRIFGIVERPVNRESFPTVLMFHGFKGEHIVSIPNSSIVEEIGREGIATVRSDFRACVR